MIAGQERILTPRVVTLLVAGVCYFAVAGISFPVLPRLVEQELDGSKTQIGLAFAVFAFGMLLIRPFAGYVSDRIGRRPLMVAGAFVIGVAQLLHVPAARHSFALLLVVRLVTGMAGSVMYLAQATTATEMSPPSQRAQVFATFSVAVVVGFAVGSPLGEFVMDDYGFSAAFTTAGGLAFAAALLAVALPETRPEGMRPVLRGFGDLLHPVAARVGLVNLLVFTAFMGFNGFIADYAEEVGLRQVRWVLLTYSATTLVVRAGAGRLLQTADRRLLATVTQSTVGVAAVLLAFAQGPASLYVGAFVLALGLAFNVPLLVLVAVDSASDEDRSRVVATVTTFGDLANSLGVFALGALADVVDYRGMYLFVATGAAAAVVLVRSPFMAPVTGFGRARP